MELQVFEKDWKITGFEPATSGTRGNRAAIPSSYKTPRFLSNQVVIYLNLRTRGHLSNENYFEELPKRNKLPRKSSSLKRSGGENMKPAWELSKFSVFLFKSAFLPLLLFSLSCCELKPGCGGNEDDDDDDDDDDVKRTLVATLGRWTSSARRQFGLMRSPVSAMRRNRPRIGRFSSF